MPNPTSVISPNCTTVTVVSTAGGTLLIAANPTRSGLIIFNRSAVVITILPLQPVANVPVAGATGFGQDIAAGASAGFGPGLSGLGFATALVPTAAIQAIAASATAVVTVFEFT